MRGGQRSRCYHPLAAIDAAIIPGIHLPQRGQDPRGAGRSGGGHGHF